MASLDRQGGPARSGGAQLDRVLAVPQVQRRDVRDLPVLDLRQEGHVERVHLEHDGLVIDSRRRGEGDADDGAPLGDQACGLRGPRRQRQGGRRGFLRGGRRCGGSRWLLSDGPDPRRP